MISELATNYALNVRSAKVNLPIVLITALIAGKGRQKGVVKNDEMFRFALRKKAEKDNIEYMVYREEEKQDEEDENALIFLRKQMKDLKKYLQEHGMT